jgi:hypothetical protein
MTDFSREERGGKLQSYVEREKIFFSKLLEVLQG